VTAGCSCSRPEPDRGRGSRAGAEVTNSRPCGGGLGAQPTGDLGQAAGEQADVEYVGPVEFLLRGEQVEQERAQASFVQNAGDVTVARAVPAAAAAVGEYHDPARVLGPGIGEASRAGKGAVMHAVIVGCGRTGTALAVRLDAEGDSVSAIDIDSRAREQLPGGFGGEFVAGSGLRRPVLEAAGIERADALVALTSSDSLNIVIARIARQVFRVPAVVGRLTGVEHTAVATELGLDMVASVAMTVDRVHRMLHHSPLEPEYTFGNGETLLVRAPIPDYLAGRLAAEFNVEGEITAVEITRGGHSMIPGPGTALRPGDRVSFVVASTAL